MRIRLPFSPRHLALVPISAVMVLPLVWMLVTSVESLDQTRHFPPTLIPSSIHWSNYRDAWNQAPFGRFFVNSLIVTGTAVLSNLILCSLAGYAFARLRFLGRELLFVALLATLMVPFQVIMIPTFLIVQHLGLVDSLGGLIAPNLVTPFGIFLLRQFFRTLPAELEDAARIDGAGELRIFWQIMFPLAMPAVATLAIFSFQGGWNAFLWPLLVTTTDDMRTIQVGLTVFVQQYSTQWDQLMAATVVATLPIIAVFAAAQRLLVKGIAYTGLKG
jgi:multiple sugar transport system permease protein